MVLTLQDTMTEARPRPNGYDTSYNFCLETTLVSRLNCMFGAVCGVYTQWALGWRLSYRAVHVVIICCLDSCTPRCLSCYAAWDTCLLSTVCCLTDLATTSLL